MSDIKFADFNEFGTLEECEAYIKTHRAPQYEGYFFSCTDGIHRMDSSWHKICGWNYGPRDTGHYKYFCFRTLYEGKQEWHFFCVATEEDTEKASQQLEQWINEGMYNELVTIQDDDDDFVV